MPIYPWSTSSSPYPGATGAVAAKAAGLNTRFGIDITTWAEPGQTYPDLDPNFTEISETSRRCVSEAVARTLCQQRGSLEDAPNSGYDLRAVLRRPWTRRHLFDVKSSVEGEALKDERVYSASAAMKWDERAKSLNIALSLETLTGKFPLVLSISEVSVAILRQA